MTTPLVISAISLCICVFSFLFFRWYIVRKTAARELLVDYRAEVYRLIAEIDAAADRDSLLVEERIKTLKKLLDDTDRRIGVYMRELQRSKNGEAMYASLGRGIRAALDSRSAQEIIMENGHPMDGGHPTDGGRLIDGSELQRSDYEQQPPLSSAATNKSEGPPTPAAPEEPPASSASKKRKPKKTKLKVQIAEMSAQGLSPSEIASRLNLSHAEVDLALNLLYRSSGNES